jgi:hypothetical protein
VSGSCDPRSVGDATECGGVGTECQACNASQSCASFNLATTTACTGTSFCCGGTCVSSDTGLNQTCGGTGNDSDCTGTWTCSGTAAVCHVSSTQSCGYCTDDTPFVGTCAGTTCSATPGTGCAKCTQCQRAASTATCAGTYGQNFTDPTPPGFCQTNTDCGLPVPPPTYACACNGQSGASAACLFDLGVSCSHDSECASGHCTGSGSKTCTLN